jgi:hypothetical protein
LRSEREALKQATAKLEEREQQVAGHVAHLIKLKERYETNDTTFRQVDSALLVSRTHSSTIEKELSETKLAGAALKVTFWLSMLRLRGVWWWGGWYCWTAGSDCCVCVCVAQMEVAESMRSLLTLNTQAQEVSRELHLGAQVLHLRGHQELTAMKAQLQSTQTALATATRQLPPATVMARPALPPPRRPLPPPTAPVPVNAWAGGPPQPSVSGTQRYRAQPPTPPPANSGRVYARILSQLETDGWTGDTRDATSVSPPPENEEWTRPRARPQSNMRRNHQ